MGSLKEKAECVDEGLNFRWCVWRVRDGGINANMEEFANTVSLEHTAKLRWGDSLMVTGGVTTELDDCPIMNKLHG